MPVFDFEEDLEDEDAEDDTEAEERRWIKMGVRRRESNRRSLNRSPMLYPCRHESLITVPCKLSYQIQRAGK